jgi:hypothetical protein
MLNLFNYFSPACLALSPIKLFLDFLQRTFCTHFNVTDVASSVVQKQATLFYRDFHLLGI